MTLDTLKHAFSRDLTLDEWYAIGRTLHDAHQTVQWLIGDWWNARPRRYGDFATQEQRDELRTNTGYAYNSVRTYGQTAERFAASVRDSRVPYWYYQATVGLPFRAAMFMIQRVASGEFTSAVEFKQAVQREKRTIDVAPDNARSWRHGIGPAEFDRRITAQNGLCDAGCGRIATVIDHDHNHCPGAHGCAICVRGILCDACNVTLGAIESGKFVALYAYLERWRQQA